MDNLEKIAVLIDADNTQLSKLEDVIREVSKHGRIVVKRAYGNWKKETLKNWENELKRLAIKAEQQFDYVSGKNATDIALVIDAVNLLHKGLYDAFVIVASDSDYTPLAINLHESGVYVMGVGEQKTPESFKNSCDEFVFLENISGKVTESQNDNIAFEHKTKSKETKAIREESQNIDAIHNLLKIAADTYQDDEGYVNVSAAGAYIKRAKPDFDARTFGYTKLPDLIKDFPEKYKIKRYPGKGTVTIVAYKCIEKR
ncbi:MAG: NYN domain-containing protein [Lachnospiraceae bacterium]|nr:NYN domain-containing protein [Lachnospiraceae bacterium]